MNHNVQISTEEYINNSNISDSLEFYKQKFQVVEASLQTYKEKNQQEKEQFKQIVIQFYSTTMLSTTPEELEELLAKEDGINEEKYLQTISEWLINLEFCIYLSDVANMIVNAHRDPNEPSKVDLDRAIRTENNNFIRHFEKVNKEYYIDTLQGFNEQYSIGLTRL